MLVLSRRADETIVFPSVGITVRVLRIQGRVARIGIEAPPHIKVLREELGPGCDTSPAPERDHELRNRLSRVTLALHLFERQRAAGLDTEAAATLSRAFDLLAGLGCAPVEPVAPSGPAPVPPRVRALLVEDDANERALLSGLLRMNGCECATAADGLEALRHLRTQARPDVVLLDMQMPRCNGATALRAIRAERRLDGLRVYGVSGSSPEALGVAVGPGGADGWFAKPLDPGALWAALQQNLAGAVRD